jgi:hypothetical protein
MSTRVLVPLVAAVIVAASGAAHAVSPQPEPPKLFGMVGLARGQTMRLNAVNVTGGPGDLPRSLTRVVLGFIDDQGHRLGEPVRAVLEPGASTFAELSFDRLPAGVEAHRTVRPFALSDREEALPLDPCRVTLEVIDDETGRTTLLVQAPVAR